MNDWLTEEAARGMWNLSQAEKHRPPSQVVPWAAFLNIMHNIVLRDDLPENPTLLDVGCGIGAYAGLIDRYYLGFQYIGCDFSPHMIKYAQQDHGDRFFEADILSLQKGADVILASSVLEPCPRWREALTHLMELDFKYLILHRARLWNDSAQETWEDFYWVELYGMETFMVIHNRPELMAMIRQVGGEILQILEYQIQLDFNLCALLVRHDDTFREKHRTVS